MKRNIKNADANKQNGRIKLKRALSIVFSIFCIVLTFVMLINVIKPPKYQIALGDIASQSIRAAKDVVDKISYQQARKQAEDGVKDVYSVNTEVTDKISDDISAQFEKMEQAHKQAQVQTGTSEQYIDALCDMLDIDCSEQEMILLISLSGERIQQMESTVDTVVNSRLREGIMPGDLENVTAEFTEQITSFIGSEDNDRILGRLSVRIVEKYLQANKFYDKDATEDARRKVADTVKEDSFRYKKNDVIVDKDDIITEAQFAMLSDLGMIDDGNVDISMYIGAFLLVTVLLQLVALYIIIYEKELIQTPLKLLMLSILILLSVGFAVLMRDIAPGLAQIAIGTILIAVLLKPRIALITNVALSVILGLVVSDTTELLGSETVVSIIVSLVAGSMAVYHCSNVTRRIRIMLAGVAVGATGSVVTVILGLILSNDIVTTLINALWPLGSGILSGILCVGTLPMWEQLFGVLTPSRLAELTNSNQPLIRRLALEAPGTHHHSIVVANIAESGAQAIGADSMLVRAGAYYHDIGKLACPEAYTENQRDGENYHQLLSPQDSAVIIKSHPTNGFELAQKNKLPKEVCNMILEHHGTTVVGYFYAKAMESGTADKADFAYPGPRPTTKETAILMLADSSEAAVRSMKEKTPEGIREKIKAIVHDRLENGQFDCCDITVGELNCLVEEFTKILCGIYHKRVEYPDIKSTNEDTSARARLFGEGDNK